MTIAVDHPPMAVPGVARRPSTRPLRFAAITAGSGLAMLVGHDGSPGWLLARVGVVAALTVALVVAVERAGRRVTGRLAVLAGVPATAVAIGFAPHLVKHVPLAVQAATVLLAVGALGLVIGGAVTAARTHRSGLGGRRPRGGHGAGTA